MESRWGRGGSKKLLCDENLLEAWGLEIGGYFWGGHGNIPQNSCAFIFLPPYIDLSPIHLDSTVWETFTPNKYLLGIFSRSVPGSILPFVTFSNRGLCFHFIPGDFSRIWRNFSTRIIPGLIYSSFQWLGDCTLNSAGFKGALSLALFKAVWNNALLLIPEAQLRKIRQEGNLFMFVLGL